MKKLILIIIATFSLQLNYSQNLSIESNLDGLILNIGDTFQAESYISDLDGNKSTCERLIYYQKDGVFNVGATIDPTGIFVANEPGVFEIVAVEHCGSSLKMPSLASQNQKNDWIVPTTCAKTKVMSSQKKVYLVHLGFIARVFKVVVVVVVVVKRNRFWVFDTCPKPKWEQRVMYFTCLRLLY